MDWASGDKLVISAGLRGHEQEVTVLRVAANVVTLSSPLTGAHRCGLLDINGTVVDARCSVGLLTRNINIKAVGSNDDFNYGFSMKTFPGHGLECVEKTFRHWMPGMAAAGSKKKFCSRGPVLQGVAIDTTSAVVCAPAVEPGFRVSGATFRGCSWTGGHGAPTARGTLFGCIPGGEIGSTLFGGATIFNDNVVYKTRGIVGAVNRGSTVHNNFGVITDFSWLGGGVTIRHNHITGGDSADAAGLLFDGDSQCDKVDPADFGSLQNHDNIVSNAKAGIALMSGCLHNHTVWDTANGLGVHLLDTYVGDVHLVDNGVAAMFRSTQMVSCVKLPVAVSPSMNRKAVFADSLVVGCRDHTSVSGAVPGACRVYKGLIVTGMTVRNVRFARYQAGEIIFSTLKYSPIGGVNPMRLHNVSTIDVSPDRLIRFSHATKADDQQQWAFPSRPGPHLLGGVDLDTSCASEYNSPPQACSTPRGRVYCDPRYGNAGVGGTNGARVVDDGFSRMLVVDRDGTFLQGGAGATAIAGDQEWPLSIARACASVNLLDRQDCMWWMKDQPELMAVAQETGLQGMQRKAVYGDHTAECTYNAGMNSYMCDPKMKFLDIMIYDKEVRSINAERLAGPIGFSQVCGYAQGEESDCEDTARGAKGDETNGGAFSDYLRGISKPGLTDAENGDTADGWFGREDITNDFKAIGIHNHKYRIDYTGTTPKTIGLQLPFADPDDSVTLIIWYSSPKQLSVKDGLGNGMRQIDRKTNVRPGRKDAWYFDRLLREIHITLKGTSAVTIITREVVQVSLTVAVTVQQFFGAGGAEYKNAFVANMASVLMINPDRVRIVDIVPGNARRRLLHADPGHQPHSAALALSHPALSDSFSESFSYQNRHLLEEGGGSAKVDFEVGEEDKCRDVFCGSGAGTALNQVRGSLDCATAH